MPSLNRAQLIGNLGRDPEARYTANGKKYATFALAVNRTWKSATGEKQEQTDWFLVNAWGKLADICLNYLKKGRLVYVDGRLPTERWENKGEIHFRTTISRRRCSCSTGGRRNRKKSKGWRRKGLIEHRSL